MRNAFRFVISSILAITILLSGSSFTFGKMVCLETGYTIIDYKKVEDCCDRKSTEPSIYKAECCEITNVDLTVDHFVNAKPVLAKMDAAPAPFHSVVLITATAAASSCSPAPLLVQPPPEPPSAILHSICQYRI